MQHVRESDVFVILLTAEVMSRPWCILEIHAAVSAGVPIVGVTLRGKVGWVVVSTFGWVLVTARPSWGLGYEIKTAHLTVPYG